MQNVEGYNRALRYYHMLNLPISKYIGVAKLSQLLLAFHFLRFAHAIQHWNISILLLA